MKDDSFAAMFKAVMIFLVVIFVAILLLAKYLTSGFYETTTAGGSTEDKAVAERIAPIAQVQLAGDKPAAAAGAAMSGKDVFSAACFACHGTGAAGAPKIGDKAAWGPRIAKGADTLHQHALNGFQGNSGVMPAKGGRADLSDDAVMAAVDYMVGESK